MSNQKIISLVLTSQIKYFVLNDFHILFSHFTIHLIYWFKKIVCANFEIQQIAGKKVEQKKG